ncbi:hypothetical protein [Terriglobus tenax]|nr:hypothetical protein [Terriglobus tenax]
MPVSVVAALQMCKCFLPVISRVYKVDALWETFLEISAMFASGGLTAE